MVTEHALMQVAAMNLAAPVAVLALRRARADSRPRPQLAAILWPVAALQLALVWAWNLPAGVARLADGPLALAALPVLVGCAVSFWLAVADAARERPWTALSALLVSAKLVSLLGVLLTFSPRALHDGLAAFDGTAAGIAARADQQMAGLVLLLGGTLGYIPAAVVIVARQIARIDRAPDWTGGAT
jgi:cytochrome c oxidase assembly factor CtaG